MRRHHTSCASSIKLIISNMPDVTVLFIKNANVAKPCHIKDKLQLKFVTYKKFC